MHKHSQIHRPGLPGNGSYKEQRESMIRVNQAGEYGAKRIYAGQIDALKGHEHLAHIQHMQDQEQVHLDYFDQAIHTHHVRPTALQPLWHILGYALGYITGKMSYRAAMACTAAVERVIDKHYASQLEILESSDQPLKEKIAQFRAEEQEHEHTAYLHGADQTFGFPFLHALIGAGSRAAIWCAKRF